MSNHSENHDFGKQVKKLFNDCIDLTPTEQKQLIKQSKASKAIKTMVLELLSSQSDSITNLTESLTQTVNNNLGLTPLKAGNLIENYQLIELIGYGGQGEVWLATRIDGEFTHKVAIKFIKMAHDEREMARFQTEREVLASLQHPNIAQLLGGGKYKDDRLYMILEWIDGLTIFDYAQKNFKSLDEYLMCFSQVCEAVSFAHHNGIIHRDIKPSNIFVTTEGTVKLLDFGIAKNIIDQKADTKSTAMMTIAYSSPEQINGQPISTASDIYALGLVLYELLTGKQAQHEATHSPADLIRSVVDTVPKLPSQVIKQHTIDPPIPNSGKKLKGDLDNLVMMAIRKEPERRYSSVKDLNKDIHNFLESKPLIASGDSVAYKFKKLIKRNVLTSLFAFMVMFFLITMPIYMYQTQQEISLQRDQAQRQALLATETSDFLINILKSASPLGINGKDTKLEDVLKMGEQQIQYGFENQPKTKAEMYNTLGQIQHNLGNNAKATEYYRQAEIIFTELNDSEGMLHSIGQQAIMSSKSDESEKAKKLIEKAEKISQTVSDVKAIEWLHIRKATILHEQGQYKTCLKILENSLKALQLNNINDPEILGRLYNEMAICLSQEDLELKLEYNQKSLDFAKLSYGYHHPIYHGRLLNKATTLIGLERYDEAMSILNEALLLSKKLFSTKHQRYALVLSELAYAHHDLGEFGEAESYYKQANEIYKNAFGESSSLYARGINNLAFLYEDMQQYKKAEPLYKTSLEIRLVTVPDDLVLIASTKANLARLWAKMGHYEQSSELISSVIELYDKEQVSNLYNHIIVVSDTIKEGSAPEQCVNGLTQLNAVLPELAKQSSKSWRRLHAELWLGQLASKCNAIDLSKTLLSTALERSKNIYKKGSIGRQIISNEVNKLIQ